jgi:XTP/dITP diphosphohydrolase
MDDDSSHVEIIFGSYDQPGSRLLDLVEVMDQLRTQCPWTKEQTHASLSHYLLEEAYETLESLDSGDTDHLREELGDLLMQVVFHARIAAESEGWDIDTVAEGIVGKLIYRNPHVFGDETSPSATQISVDEVDATWQSLKAVEKQRSSPLDGIPERLPALAFADKVLGRIGAITVPGDDLGSRLLALVQEARAEGVNAEEALRKSVRSLVP